MRKNKPILVLFVVFLVLLLAGWLLYQIPEVQARLAWRIDRTVTYLRGVVDPVQPLPTPLPQPSQTIVPTKTPPPPPPITPPPHPDPHIDATAAYGCADRYADLYTNPAAGQCDLACASVR